MAAEATTDGIRLPPPVRLPKIVQGAALLTARPWAIKQISRRYGAQFTLNLPIFGRVTVIGDPVLIKDIYRANSDLAHRRSNLGTVLGPGSTFSLDGDAHRARRKLMVAPFHGKSMRSYEPIVEQEVLREIATWPEGEEFATLQPMMRITLNAILRAVFGAHGQAFDELRELLPPWVELGSRLVALPTWARRDVGSWSPWGRFLRSRRRYDEIIERLIAQARTDPDLPHRKDILALLLQSRYDDGTAIPERDIADELLTMLVAGHETTATTLAWTIERLSRHPSVMARLVAEVDAGGSDLLQATIWEVQRTRPTIDGSMRIARQRIRLGQWVIPEGHSVYASAMVTHHAESNYGHAEEFDPERFAEGPPGPYSWIPFGGGVHRCIGAAFANMEMMVTLRTLLRERDFAATTRNPERFHSRGVAMAPADGGLAVVYRRHGSALPADPAHAAAR